MREKNVRHHLWRHDVMTSKLGERTRSTLRAIRQNAHALIFAPKAAITPKSRYFCHATVHLHRQPWLCCPANKGTDFFNEEYIVRRPTTLEHFGTLSSKPRLWYRGNDFLQNEIYRLSQFFHKIRYTYLILRNNFSISHVLTLLENKSGDRFHHQALSLWSIIAKKNQKYKVVIVFCRNFSQNVHVNGKNGYTIPRFATKLHIFE